MKDRKLHIPIYNACLTICICDTMQSVGEEYGIEDLSESNAKTMVKTFDDGKKGYLIAFKIISPSNIAHECLHFVNMLFEERGISYSLENDEHAAYLLGYVVDKCHEFLYKKNGKPKKP